MKRFREEGAAALKRRDIVAPAPSTITEVLRRNGATLGAFGGEAARFIRFEQPAPNDLWQMDVKGHAQRPLAPMEQTETLKIQLIMAKRRLPKAFALRPTQIVDTCEVYFRHQL